VYMAFQNAHDPYEHAPPQLVTRYSESMNPLRRNFSAIVEDLDRGVGAMVQLLKKSGLWEDSIIWFTSDNGAELPFIDQSKCGSTCLTTGCCGGAGSNYPLRGGKFGLFEGGIRARTFIYSERIPKTRRGTTWSGLSHVSDIFATMAGWAGALLSVRGTDAEGKVLGTIVDGVKTDGFDLWKPIISNMESPRTELVHQPINTYWNTSCRKSDLANPFMPSCGSAITVLPYKLLVGFPGDNRVFSWSVPQEFNTVSHDLCVESPCLYNIEEDPSEANDLAPSNPDIVEALLARLRQLSIPEAAPQPPDALTPDPPDAACAVVVATGAWLPWDVPAQLLV